MVRRNTPEIWGKKESKNTKEEKKLQILNSGCDLELGEKDYSSLIVSQSTGGKISLWHDRAVLPLSPPPQHFHKNLRLIGLQAFLSVHKADLADKFFFLQSLKKSPCLTAQTTRKVSPHPAVTVTWVCVRVSTCVCEREKEVKQEVYDHALMFPVSK